MILHSLKTWEAEVSLVQGYTGNVDLLSDVDRFFKELSNIPLLSQRLKYLNFRQGLREDLTELKLDFETFRMVLSNLLKSSKLTQLLEMILAVGNYMNGQSNRGGYWGFQVEFLPKLQDTKSVDNKSSLLDYILEYMEKTDTSNGTKLVTILDDFALLQSLTSKEFHQLESNFLKLKTTFEAAGRQRTVPKCVPEDRYGLVMGQFYDENKEMVMSVAELLNSVKELFSDVVRKFGCNRDITMNDLVSIFATFFRQLTELRAELTKRRELEAELARKKEANEAMQRRLREETQRRKQGKENLVDGYTTMRTLQLKGRDRSNHMPVEGMTMATVRQRMMFRCDNDSFGVESTMRLGKPGTLQLKALQNAIPGSILQSRQSLRVSPTLIDSPRKKELSIRQDTLRIARNQSPTRFFDPVTFSDSTLSTEQPRSDED